MAPSTQRAPTLCLLVMALLRLLQADIKAHSLLNTFL